MNKLPIYPQSSDLRSLAIFIFSAFELAAFIYLTQYSMIEIPNKYYGSDKVVNHAGIWAGLGIGMSGFIFGGILWGLAKCREELSCIRVLMNEAAGRAYPEPAQPAPTPEENTYEPQAPDNK